MPPFGPVSFCVPDFLQPDRVQKILCATESGESDQRIALWPIIRGNRTGFAMTGAIAHGAEIKGNIGQQGPQSRRDDGCNDCDVQSRLPVCAAPIRGAH
jgi:hypothetical protein